MSDDIVYNTELSKRAHGKLNLIDIESKKYIKEWEQGEMRAK